MAGAGGVASFMMRRAGADGVPSTPALHYSGTLLENGQPVDGDRSVTVAFWTAPSGGTEACAATENTRVEKGRFRVPLSDGCLGAVRANRDLWAEVRFPGTTLPRRKVSAAWYAIEAEVANAARSVAFAGVTGVGASTVWPGTVPSTRVTGLARFQSGVVHANATLVPGWSLGAGSGERSNQGFDLKMVTWGDSFVSGLRVSWFAYVD
jgi:hypothetical protein